MSELGAGGFFFGGEVGGCTDQTCPAILGMTTITPLNSNRHMSPSNSGFYVWCSNISLFMVCYILYCIYMVIRLMPVKLAKIEITHFKHVTSILVYGLDPRHECWSIVCIPNSMFRKTNSSIIYWFIIHFRQSIPKTKQSWKYGQALLATSILKNCAHNPFIIAAA